jgi:hypothetical protein
MRGPQSGLILPHVPGGTNVNLQRLRDPGDRGSLWHRAPGVRYTSY